MFEDSQDRPFAINPETGVITLSQSLDYESEHLYSFNVRHLFFFYYNLAHIYRFLCPSDCSKGNRDSRSALWHCRRGNICDECQRQCPSVP